MKANGKFFELEDVSIDVPRTSIFGFIGPRGSGKTTTVRLLTGVYTPTE
jgi:ABC-2 type transport system ATP-binding protein